MDTNIHNLQRNDQKDVQRWVPIASKKKQKQPNLSRPENTPMSIAAPGSRTFDLSRSHLYCHLDRTLLADGLRVLCTLASNTLSITSSVSSLHGLQSPYQPITFSFPFLPASTCCLQQPLCLPPSRETQ